MGKLLQLKKKIELIEEMRDFYSDEQVSLQDNIDNLKSEIDNVFNSRHNNIEIELETKRLQEEKALEIKYKVELQKIKEEIENKKRAINEAMDHIIKEKKTRVENDCVALNMLVSNKELIQSKFEELNISSSARASIKRSDIPYYTREQIIEILKSGIETEQMVNELTLKDINVAVIDKNFWFPAGKLDGNLQNQNIVDVLKFVNIVGVAVVVGLYSDFIVTGLLGALAYFGYKNVNETKSVNEYRDWLYTIYEYEDDLRKNIEDFYDEEYKFPINDYKSQLKVLESSCKQQEERIDSELQDAIARLKYEYKNMKDMKKAGVNSDLTTELKDIKVNTVESLKKISSLMIEFTKNVVSERKKMESEFNELNSYRLEIVNDHSSLDLHKMHLGVEVSDTSVNYFDDLPFGSYLFVHSQDKLKMRNLMKYLTCQLSSRLKGNLLSINVLDPLSYGEGLSEIIDEKSVSQYYNESEVSEKIDSILDKFTKDIKDVFTGYNDILEYNNEKNTKGSKPYAYTLNLIQNINMFDDMSRFKQLLQTRKSGVINFILISSDLIDEVQKGLKDSEVKRAEFLDILDSFVRLFTCAGDGKVKTGNTEEDLDIIDDITEENDVIEKLNNQLIKDIQQVIDDLYLTVKKYSVTEIAFSSFNYKSEYFKDIGEQDIFECVEIDSSIFRGFAKQITDNIKRSQMLIFYFKDFLDRVVPKGTEFTAPCIKGLDMHFGYKDGDVEKPMPIPLDGETIHYFMGGRTGMGKSNTLNAGLNTLIRMYSPDDLNIYYMDFKVVEGKKYMRDPTPHFKCISVTADPYYLISLFDHLIKVLKERQEVLLPSYNAGKLADIKKKGVKIPEIVVIIDEFTEGLKGTDEVKSAIIESSDTIARLGRASGVHLFYTSQDVSSKIPDGMLGQFAGRLSLPVNNGETSKQILMNTSAADPDFMEMGNLLFNNKAGDEKYNVKFKVPLIEPEDMNENLAYVNSLCKDKWDLNCVMFDEDEEKTEEELDSILNKYAEDLNEMDKVVVGGNAQYSTEDSPVGFDLKREDSNNILIISQGKKRRIELTNTIVKNIAKTRGENTALFVLRGNKDYLDVNYVEKYKNDFKVIIEFESIGQILDNIENSRLAVLESELKEYGVLYDEKSENFEDNFNCPKFAEEWNRVKGLTLSEGTVEIKKIYMSKLIESLRPYTTQALVLAEGIDEMYGIGIDSYSTIDRLSLLRYAPYYGVLNVWNTPKLPGMFGKFEPVFRHTLIGSLNEMDAFEYKFMKDTKNSYGGYVNSVNKAEAFKFKIFKMDNIFDDEKSDNRISLNKIR